ncbi:aromatic ring-hydroxylating dioxygenase subunit alpha [Ramlibacter sp. AW1]|uniref:Aromatic ring-hydroxylating dioxygenase subunit alpha n=1 Tax=Ramlibacter aurantiacus TaxID=2801330 RepID=A0A936ZEF0_9BURK|nr:aromatic ring-hydroxylating dioxygenase subunit alpha [Ramlibacter aurantiacus]MBL0420039.1 aromatic ring-hydroxylating dioxygenase subunit alpha [Ramlibacter aurantiacus]
MWLKNTWYPAAYANELDEPFLARRILGTALVLYRASDGTVTALEDVCPHRLMPLSVGRRVGDDIQCGYHGMRFDVEGRCLEVPGQTQVPAAATVRRYPTVQLHGFIWIWMGDESLADPALIPDLHWNDDPHWTASRGYHHVAADYRLLNDNLQDLSHETYVHARTIGNGEEETIANFPVKVTVEANRVVRAWREMPNIVPPPFFSAVLDHPPRIDRWQCAIHLVPGINMTYLGVYPVGQPRSGAAVMHVLHLATPETETSCHYFWSGLRNFKLEDKALTDMISKAVGDTLAEDKVVLEHQQRKLAEMGAPAVPRVAIRLDEAPLRARRLLDEWLQRERENPGSVITPVPLVPAS